MRTLRFFLLLLISFAAPLRAQDSIVIGRALSQNFVEEVKIDCPANAICLDVWWRWEIEVTHNLINRPNSTPIKGRIRAVNLQHGQLTPEALARLKAFIIRPIDDPKKRELFQADYQLVARSTGQEMFCFHTKPSDNLISKAYISKETEGTAFCVESK